MRGRYVRVRHASGVGVAERWRKAYQKASGKWIDTAMGGSEQVYNELCALGPAPDPEAAAAVIGNKSWTHLRCDGCGVGVLTAIEIGCGYGADQTILCRTCVAEAAQVMKEQAA